MPTKDYLKRVGKKPIPYTFGESEECISFTSVKPAYIRSRTLSNTVTISKKEQSELESRAEQDALNDIASEWGEKATKINLDAMGYQVLASEILLGGKDDARKLKSLY